MTSIGTIISDQETPTFDTFRFRPSPEANLAPGEFVSVKVSENKHLIGRIIKSKETNPHEEVENVVTRQTLGIKADYPEEGESVIIYRTYEVEVIEELLEKESKIYTVPIDTLVKSGSDVNIPSATMIQEFLGLNASIDDSYNIGKLDIPGGNSQNLYVKKDIIQRHIFIGGTTGSGKSYAAKVLAEEIHKKGVPIIFFDTQEEFSPLTVKLGGKVLKPIDDYTVRISSLSFDEILNIVTFTNNLHEAILNRAVLELRESNPEFTVDDLTTIIPVITTDMGTSNPQQTSRIVSDRVRYQIGGRRYIGGRYKWEDVLKKDTIININCKDFERRDLQAVLAATLRDLQNLRKQGKVPPFVIFIDEAHLFVPDDENTACKQLIRESVRMGRHHGICNILITQSPNDIDKKVIRQCNTRLLFALEQDQLNSIQGVKADATQEMLARLPKSQQGSCILTGTYETIKHALPMKIRELDNKDSDAGKTPDIFSQIEKFK